MDGKGSGAGVLLLKVWNVGILSIFIALSSAKTRFSLLEKKCHGNL